MLRYDYTESCKGKDLCDRESAVVNTVINSFVSLGKDLLSANRMFTAVQYGRGLTNTEACVLEMYYEVIIGQ